MSFSVYGRRWLDFWPITARPLHLSRQKMWVTHFPLVSILMYCHFLSNSFIFFFLFNKWFIKILSCKWDWFIAVLVALDVHFSQNTLGLLYNCLTLSYMSTPHASALSGALHFHLFIRLWDLLCLYPSALTKNACCFSRVWFHPILLLNLRPKVCNWAQSSFSL